MTTPQPAAPAPTLPADATLGASRSPLRTWQVVTPFAVAAASAAGVGLRYALQGTGNVYTNTARAFYFTDPILGWSPTRERWVWLGLDALGVVVAIALGTVAVAWLAGALARRHRAGRLAPGWASAAVLAFWIGACLCVATPTVPILAFASGFPPAGAEANLPTAAPRPIAPATAPGAPDGPVAWADLPAGDYAVLQHADANGLVAQIAAGEETFDARFGPLTGTITLDPTDLGRAHGSVSAPAASIDTGIALRSKHARDDLKPETYPTLALTVARLSQVTADGAHLVRFEGTGTFGVMGTSLDLPLTGTVKRLDDAARAQLSVTNAVALLVQARLEVPLARTPLGTDDFDKDTIVVSAQFILTPATH